MMMPQARLYDNPQEFGEMIVQHLKSSLNLDVRQQEEEPLLLEIVYGPDKEDDRAVVSLHNTFQTYMRSGDFNTAIDYLNGVISCSNAMQNKEELLMIDTTCIYPALRDQKYVEEAAQGLELIVEENIPGLCTVFLEIKDGYSKLISQKMLEHHPRLNEEKVKRLGYRNLRSEGWTPSRMTLQSPFRPSCYVETFLDNPFPIECQFINPDMSRGHVPASFLIAFPTRRTVLLMRSEEKMDTLAQAKQLAKKSKFHEMVRRSYRVMPHPVSEHIYWSCNGEIQRLENV
ncbi:hypothetical protein E5161_18495 [Cohnella pontilimi]|uniref:Uncharacterized protein n=1 Tax=Cohnella pontilimi TaxID=2564100 RepID=A0A4U0F4P4_9BACL|nr:hypothetical protein [Cohnella pontilimi]TJY39565.1 hypothetical protein E5161_18495 [Cohnella pontilimi]